MLPLLPKSNSNFAFRDLKNAKCCKKKSQLRQKRQ